MKKNMLRSLDRKLAAIRANPQSTREFILADAKDADMAFGVRAPGQRGYLARPGARPAQFSPEIWTREEYGHRNLPEFLDIIREVTQQGLVDIMLMSAYVSEQLTIKERLFENSQVTPACRANDTTDVWAVRHGCYTREPSQPFRSASIDQIQCGQIECDREGKDIPGANLGLYSITFLNELVPDREALRWYKEFREEAERKQFRHFLACADCQHLEAVGHTTGHPLIKLHPLIFLHLAEFRGRRGQFGGRGFNFDGRATRRRRGDFQMIGHVMPPLSWLADMMQWRPRGRRHALGRPDN